MINFGVGKLSLIPSGSNPTPVQIGILKGVSIDIDMSLVELRGDKIFAVDVANGAGKIGIKAEAAQINGGLFAAVLSGATVTGGPTGVSKTMAEHSAVFTTPTPIVVTGGGTFFEDMGVVDLTSGLPLTRVASGPATGQYTVNTATGSYLFAAADTGHTMLITYAYGTTVAGSKTTTYVNQPMGTGTTFICDAFNNYGGDNLGLRFPASKFTKLSMAMKSEDYTVPSLEGAAFAAQDGTIVSVYTGD